ncbi:MAG: hypothetical protein QMD00_05240 [Hadesarchaea archaeon]|nr:hypothetical protein [Hadesarchaea archaeon]
MNWWEIGENQFVHLTPLACKIIEKRARNKYGSLIRLGKEIGVGTLLYSKFRYEKQGIRSLLLKTILDKLELPPEQLNKHVYAIGFNKRIKSMRFPVTLEPAFGELLAHVLFDGYADTSILRYSNYDVEIREEFIELIRQLKLGQTRVNAPENFRRDIDLPECFPKLLSAIFGIHEFHSDIARIPDKFYELVKEEPLFGWYFIKGAFLDEGSLTGGQIWLLRGVTNKALIDGTMKICELVNVKVGTMITNRNYFPMGHSLYIRRSSYGFFNEILQKTMWRSCKKVRKVFDKVKRQRKFQEREKKVAVDCERIIEMVKREGYITLSVVKRICKVSDNSALARLLMLSLLGVLIRQRVGREIRYYLAKRDLPENLPSLNAIRRKVGWR